MNPIVPLVLSLLLAPALSVDLCRTVLAPEEAAELTGVSRDFYLRGNEVSATNYVCRWAVPVLDPGPQCKNASTEKYATGDCTVRIVEISFDCDPQSTRRTNAEAYVETLYALGQEPVEIGDVGAWKSTSKSNMLTFAVSGCVVRIQRVPEEPKGEITSDQLKENFLEIAKRIVVEIQE